MDYILQMCFTNYMIKCCEWLRIISDSVQGENKIMFCLHLYKIYLLIFIIKL